MPSDRPTPITSPLAPDLEAVKEFLRAMFARGAIVEVITAVIALLTRMRELNTELLAKLAAKKRARPPSETFRRLQLELPFVAARVAANDNAPPKPEKKKRGPKKRGNCGRKKLPAHLRRVPVDRPVPEDKRTCPTCGIEAKTMTWKTAEKLDVRPAEFIVVQERREVCACQRCHEYVVTADKQDEVLDRGLLGNDLLIEALVDHYDDAVPWERMERSAREQGVPLSANTLAASVGRVIDLLDPIALHIKEKTLSSDYTALDATSMPVLDEDHPLGIRTGTLWLVEGDHRYAFFAFAPSGHADHLAKLFADHVLRSVMCDGSATNNCVEDKGGTRGGCHAHGRRKLVEALRLGDTRATEGIEIYAKLFHVDAESKRAGESLAERFARRERDSVPIVACLRAWVDKMRADVEPKSKLGNALGYLHRQWTRLTVFLRDPLMELTNNEVERDLRRWVLDRKTWLFLGHEESARRAASALTLLTTCRKMRLEPRRYLRETLAKILAGERSLTALLPETHERLVAQERAAAELRDAA
jgi:transposase